ncbi:cytochrome c biogenesis heme-transporting ATPase CcmA [Marinomonas balearica]|uniref:Heme exporter protein A n=1 Tax=Marinomonas balearica TaxID=491947 RepID=A0A4R6MC99_9GAMM|nr:cytochrome c biogenesis heme-transporting ATPase CcmA [Marinomonas balearica]TDO98320.1 heme exporter protein A [Marinomonas balearica]
MLLSIKDLEIERDDKVLFSPVSFDLNSGDIIKIAGENGSGKSSLLRAILGFLTISDGTILYRGGSTNRAYNQFLKETLYIGHNTGVKDNLSVSENLYLLNGSVPKKEFSTVVDMLQLQEHMDVLCRFLSEGQKKRVALASLWLRECTLWILDEPFVSLDNVAQALIQNAILKQVAKGGAVVLTTHQPLAIPNYKEVFLS